MSKVSEAENDLGDQLLAGPMTLSDDIRAAEDMRTLQDVRQFLHDIATTGESLLDPEKLYWKVSEILGL